MIAVSDNGRGIEKADLAKIFQPFFSAKKGKGIGLGLSICSRIIENHGGRLTVESDPGKGATFRIHLPLQYKPPGRTDPFADGEESAGEASESYGFKA
jgi:signal transduction histidine kinase